MKTLLMFGLASFVAGCAPSLMLQTNAPPAATMVFSPIDDRVELTAGVALGFEVFCPWTSCTHVKATTDSTSIARVYEGNFGKMRQDFTQHAARALALVAVAPGQTTLHVWSDGRTRDYAVTVVAPADPR